jgi:hypothetical protein
MKNLWWSLVLLAALAPSLFLLWTQGQDVPTLGLFGDDTIYYSSAKSLAEGHGYRIPNLEGQPYQTKYPPLFPLLLSAAWRMNPRFPENLQIAAWLVWIAVPTYLFLALRVFQQMGLGGKLAPALVLVLACNGQVLFFGTMLMSELWFSCAILGTILASGGNAKERYPWLSGLIAAVAFLIKSSALPLLAVLPIVTRSWKPAIPLLAAIAGWNWWAGTHAVRTTDISLLYHTSYFGYYLHGLTLETFWNMATSNLRLLYSGLPRTMFLDPGSSTMENLLAAFALLAGTAGAIQLSRRSGNWQYLLFAAVYLMQLVLWNFMPTPRLLLPVVPLLLAGIAEMVRAAFEVLRSDQPVLRPGPLTALATLALVGPLVFYLAVVSTGVATVNLPAAMQENRSALAAKREAYAWIEANTPHDAGILANDDQLLYLYTGRRSASQILPVQLYYREDREVALVAELRKVPRYAREHRLDYVLVTSTDLRRENLEPFRQEWDLALSAPGSGYRKVFERPHVRIYACQECFATRYPDDSVPPIKVSVRP